MAVSQFSASRSETFLHNGSLSRLIRFGSTSRRSKLSLIRTLKSRPVSTSFSVKNVSSEPMQRVKDTVAEEGVLLLCLCNV